MNRTHERRKTLLTFVTIGGGFSGVETAAAINDMVKAVLRFYPRAQETGARMILIHSRECILQELEAGLGEFATQKLQERGVEVRLLTTVKAITSNKVVLSTEERISARTVICTVGNAPHPLMTSLPLSQERGRILVDATLQVTGTTNLWALGDAARVPVSSGSGYCPPTAQYAMRQGHHGARNILAELAGRTLETVPIRRLWTDGAYRPTLRHRQSLRGEIVWIIRLGALAELVSHEIAQLSLESPGCH